MRKSIILAAAFLAVGMMANAQKEVVKDVERMLKGSTPDNAAALQAIQPALSDPTTSGNQEAWYLAGKAAGGIYDNVYLQESLKPNSTSDADRNLAGKSLLESIKYYKKAVGLPDEKGKMPGKKTKDILKELKAYYPQIPNAGIFLFNTKDFAGASEAFTLFAEYPNDPVFEGNFPNALPDSTVNYYQVLNSRALLIDKQTEKACEVLKKLAEEGYNDIEVYQNGVTCGNILENKDVIEYFATKGYEKYGTQDIGFIGELININLDKQDYAKCHELIDKALEALTTPEQAPVKSQVYDILGIVYERENNNPKAIESFENSVKYNPDYAKGYFNKARILYNTAIVEDEASEGRTQARDVKNELLEAADLFKKAYDMDPTMSQIPSILYRIYYRLGAGYEDEASRWENM